MIKQHIVNKEADKIHINKKYRKFKESSSLKNKKIDEFHWNTPSLFF